MKTKRWLYMIKAIKNLINKHRQLVAYALVTIFISVVDIVIVRLLLSFDIKIWIANTVGVISGSLLQYILVLKFAFKIEHSNDKLLIHIATFLIGLLIADLIIHYSYLFLLEMFTKNMSFFIAKILSMLGTFFVTFFLRKKLYKI